MKRFWDKVDKSGDCWIWLSYIDNHGYGRFSSHGRSVRAHRFSYELSKGSIPSGFEVDHNCRNRSCVNPDHLDAVTRADHARRSISAIKNYCVHGHEFTFSNTYFRSNGNRTCRACIRVSVAAYKRRLLSAEAA